MRDSINRLGLFQAGGAFQVAKALNRRDQYKRFNAMVGLTLQYCLMEGIPTRIGEVHRTKEQAEWNVKKGVSKSPHFGATTLIPPKGKITGLVLEDSWREVGRTQKGGRGLQ